jgi:hypothetical protein
MKTESQPTQNSLTQSMLNRQRRWSYFWFYFFLSNKCKVYTRLFPLPTFLNLFECGTSLNHTPFIIHYQVTQNIYVYSSTKIFFFPIISFNISPKHYHNHTFLHSHLYHCNVFTQVITVLTYISLFLAKAYVPLFLSIFCMHFTKSNTIIFPTTCHDHTYNHLILKWTSSSITHIISRH